MSRRNRNIREGLTLVELLVVISIIGVLVALLLPAVQAAREAARMIHCANNVRQLALGCLNHEQQQGFFPAGGWIGAWLGDPNLGFDKRQPGGWIYNVLPYIEQQALHDIGLGDKTNYSTWPNSPALAAHQMETATTGLPALLCPTRGRRPIAYPVNSGAPGTRSVRAVPTVLGKTDYAGSCGEILIPYGSGSGPDTIAIGVAWSDSQWLTLGGNGMIGFGVFQYHHTTRIAEITDGTACTLLCGEKTICSDQYENGWDAGDKYGWDVGYDINDTGREVCDRHAIARMPLRYTCGPIMDTEGAMNHNAYPANWGSAHSNGFNMAMCDGSVRVMSYSIDLEVHRRLGDIADGLLIDAKSY